MVKIQLARLVHQRVRSVKTVTIDSRLLGRSPGTRRSAQIMHRSVLSSAVFIHKFETNKCIPHQVLTAVHDSFRRIFGCPSGYPWPCQVKINVIHFLSQYQWFRRNIMYQQDQNRKGKEDVQPVDIERTNQKHRTHRHRSNHINRGYHPTGRRPPGPIFAFAGSQQSPYPAVRGAKEDGGSMKQRRKNPNLLVV